MIYMLDTNMVSYIVKGRPSAARIRLLDLKDEDIGVVSVITEAEILYSLAKQPQATTLTTLMKDFLGNTQILPWGREEADAYGRVRAKMEKSGISLAGMDMMIAAHAIAVGAVLVTNDKALSQVDDLIGTADWTAP